MCRIIAFWRIAVFAGLIAAASNAQAVVEAAGGRSYQSIVDRNPFGLRPPPTNSVPLAPTNQPGKNLIKLTGFTTIGDHRAYFIFTDEKTKTNRTESLRVDQEKDGLRVLEIDSRLHRVKVMREGVEVVMSLATDGLTNATGGAIAASTSVPGMVPGAIPKPGSPVPPVPMPTVTPGGGTTPSYQTPGARTIPSRPVRSAAAADTMQPIYAGASAASPLGGTPPPLPIANNFTGPAPQRDGDAAQQAIMLEVQRQTNPHLNLPPVPGISP